MQKRREALNMVTAELFPAETAIDAALAHSALLLGAQVNARRHANLAAMVGQRAIEENLAALTALGEARRRLVAAHAELGQVKIEIGLRTVAAGGGGDKPAPSSEFRVVGDEESAAA
ncbi:MAG: hypothetical protein INR64_05525 [Caulobacteraceae bacterium]|nr:hypothetical protein [Caulobacter sp.]